MCIQAPTYLLILFDNLRNIQTVTKHTAQKLIYAQLTSINLTNLIPKAANIMLFDIITAYEYFSYV